MKLENMVIIFVLLLLFSPNVLAISANEGDRIQCKYNTDIRIESLQSTDPTDVTTLSIGCPSCGDGRFILVRSRTIYVYDTKTGTLLEKTRVDYYRCLDCGHQETVEISLPLN